MLKSFQIVGALEAISFLLLILFSLNMLTRRKST